jgi:hypothetical protein
MIPTAVFQPVNIDVKVGGVEVGGVFAWLQRTVVKPKTLTFTVYIGDAEQGTQETTVETAKRHMLSLPGS